MKIAFNPSTVEALIAPPNNKDIIFDLRGHNIFARGVKFCGTDTNTWRDIKINNVSIGSNTLDLRNGSNTTLTNTNGVVTINSTWRPVVDNLTSDSTTSSLSAKQGKVLKSLIDGKSNSGHNHDDRYLKLTGGTMASNALITFADSGSQGTDKGPQGARGGLYWTGQSDYAKLYAEEIAGDNLDLVIQFGDDNSNGLSIRNASNVQTSYISAGGVITTKTFKGNLDWSYIINKPATATRWPSWAEVTGKPGTFTPSAHEHNYILDIGNNNHTTFAHSKAGLTAQATEWLAAWNGYELRAIHKNQLAGMHTHAWNSLTHSSTTENQAILTNGKANGWKLYTLNISRWDNAANNAHSHSNKSVLDGITSGLVNNWNTAYTFVNTITGTDTDKVINKWEEIVNFLAGITEDNKLNTLLNSKLSVYELANNTNVGAIKNNGIYYSTTDASSDTLTNSPFNTGFALINMTSYDGGDDLRRSRLAFNAYGEIKVSNDRDQANTAETWYNVLTSKNSGINGSTIKLNGTSITVYSSGTADGRYVKKSGDTMSGVLTIDTTNFGALTIKRNDDANGASIQFRGKSSVYGYIGLNNSTKDKQFLRWNSDTSKTYIILDTSSTYVSSGKGVINGTTITQVDNATNSTDSTNARKLVNWYSARPTSLNTQFGDGSLRIFYATSSTTEGKSPDDAAVLHLAWDHNGGWDSQLAINSPLGRVYSRSQNMGTWQPWKTLAFTTDIPLSLKNPHALTISLNGTSQGPYDGSAAKNINITPGSIGAATSGHNHDGRYVYNYGGTQMDGASINKNALGMTTNSGITGDWWYILQAAWNGEYRWNSQIAFPTQNRNGMYYRSGLDDNTAWGNWIKLLDVNNYSSTLDSRYYTESEIDSLLDAKLNRQNLSYGAWNPRGYNLAADYYYNGGNLSISENDGKMYVSINGQFYQNEGQYRVLDTSDVAGLKNNLTVHQYLSNTDTTWWPLIWGGSSHDNTSDSTGEVYKSHNVLSWQTSSQTLYATNLYTGQLKTINNHYYHFNSDATLRIYGSSGDDTERIYFQAGIDNRIDDYDISSYGGEQRHSIILNPRGGFVGIGDTNPSYKLSVGGDTKITGSIRSLTIGGGIYWNPYVESASDGTDAASITLVRQGVAGGTTLVLSQMNDANDTIQFKTNGSARLYHNSYPILTTQNTYVSNNKGYINGTEITQVNNADMLDGYHENSFLRYRGATSTDQEATLWDQIGIKQYNGALPDGLTNIYNWGGVISLPGSSSRFEIYASQLSSSGNGLYYRSGWNSDKRTWLKFIDSSNIGSQSVNYANSAGNADTATNAQHLRINSANTWSTWYWAGQGGQPSWLWGSNDGTNMYVWNPNNFNVNTAQYLRSLGNQNCQTGRTQNYGDVYTYNTCKDNTGSPTNYTSVIGFGRGIAGTVEIAGGWCNTHLYWRSLRDCCDNWYSWRKVLDSRNYTEFINNYYWANVKISTSSSTTTSPTVHTLTATRVCAGHNPEIDNSISCSNWFRSSGNTGWYNTTYHGGWYMSDTSWIRAHNNVGIYTGGQIYSSSSIKMSNISLEHNDEINNSANGGLHLNYRNSGIVSLCQGGGNVGIGTTYPSHKLHVMGDTFTEGFGIMPYYLSDSNILPTISPGDGYTYRCLEIGKLPVRSCIIADKVALSNERGVLIIFNAGFDGQIVLLKDLQNYGSGNGYFWVMPSGCEIIRPEGSGIRIPYNQISNVYDDGKSRFFVYSSRYNVWIEFYCG